MDHIIMCGHPHNVIFSEVSLYFGTPQNVVVLCICTHYKYSSGIISWKEFQLTYLQTPQSLLDHLPMSLSCGGAEGGPKPCRRD